MKTKDALVWELDEPWSVEEIEIGEPRHGEVTVQLETAGLCHSDHHLVTGDFPFRVIRCSAVTKAPASSPSSARASSTWLRGDHRLRLGAAQRGGLAR